MSIYSDDDTFYGQVSILLNANASPIVDDSLYTRTYNQLGGVTVSTTVKKFGGGALTRAAGNVLRYAASSDFTLGTGDFTVECYRWLNSLAGSHYAIARANGASAQRWALANNGTDKLAWYLNGSAIIADTTNSVAQVWEHIAYSRTGGTGYLCRDGVVVASAADANDYSDTSDLSIFGAADSAVLMVAGSGVDFVRITKGVGRYVGAYTPPSEASVHATLAKTLDSWTMFGGGGGAVQVTLADWTQTAYGGGYLTKTLGDWTLSAQGGGALVETLDNWTLAGIGHNSYGENALIADLDDWSLSAAAGGYLSETLDNWSLSAEGEATARGDLAVTLADWGLSATGTVSGIGRATLEMESWTLRSSSGGVLASSADDWTIAATGSVGAVGGLAETLEAWSLAATGARGEYGRLAVTLDDWAPAANGALRVTLGAWTLTAVGGAVIAATYEAYALNLKHATKDPVDELTRYTNFGFTQILRFKGAYYGVGAAGLYLLDGTTDYAATPTAIPWAWRTAIDDFGTREKKTVAAAYFGGRLPAAATVTLYAGESGSEAYNFTTPRGAAAQNHRQKFGKGVKNRYFALGAAGEGDVTLDNIEPDIAQLARRI